MPLNVISNFAASVAHRNLQKTDAATTESLAKLSSGTRVVAAKDDAAALAIGSRLSAEVQALRQAAVNTSQATSMLQIADGALSTVQDILVRMKTLAAQASSGQLSNAERGFLNNEFQALRTEIDRIANDTEFNGVKLISGGTSNTVTTHGVKLSISNGITGLSFGPSAPITSTDSANPDVFTVNYFTDAAGGGNRFVVLDSSSNAQVVSVTGGAPAMGQTKDFFFSQFDFKLTIGSTFDTSASFNSNNTVGGFTTNGNSLTFNFKVGTGAVTTEDDLSITLQAVTTSAINAAVAGYQTDDLLTAANANAASARISQVIDFVASARASVGTSQNRLQFALANVATASENAEAARSNLVDLDVAQEMTNFTSKQILMQAGVSMLAQAQQLPQNLLRLFQ